MKAIIKISILSMLMLIGMSIHVAAQADQMVGGYADASTSNKDIKHAAAVAIREHAKSEHHSVTLVKINKAEQQVVSGMNYRLCMDVRHGKHGKVHTITAVVYEPIRKPMRLTNWQEGGCKDL